jgi:hypothetical protein
LLMESCFFLTYFLIGDPRLAARLADFINISY